MKVDYDPFVDIVLITSSLHAHRPPMFLLYLFYVILARVDIKPNEYPVLSVTESGSHLTIKSSQSGYEQKPVGNPTTGLKSCGVNSASDASMSLNREHVQQKMFCR